MSIDKSNSMNEPSIIEQAETYVKQILNKGLSEDHQYHSLSHTLAVRSACRKLGAKMGVSAEEIEILELAALFHDVGFVEIYNGHEGISRKYAKAFLSQRGYPEAKLTRVLSCIEITFPPNRPKNNLEKIIRDADLINLGSDSYTTHLTGLRHEWEVFLNQKYTDTDWYKMNQKFLKSQSFFTEAARDMYDPKLQNNISWLKKMAKGAKQAEKDSKQSVLQSNRSAQMMMKTSLRNHIDLSALADNKANIMLSVNALIITLIVPVAIAQVQTTPYIKIPVLIMLLTCLGSMIYATLATRPIKMNGSTEFSTIDKGDSNLFFFGNFYNMKFGDYKKGVYQVLDKQEDLEDSIMRDLFFLGKSLGTKYAQLRICYTIFMLGVSLTVISLLIAYGINN